MPNQRQVLLLSKLQKQVRKLTLQQRLPLIKLRSTTYVALVFIAAALLLSSCDTEVPRPDSNLCLNDVESLKQTCFNLLRDYDSDGRLKPDAKPVITQFQDSKSMLDSLHKNFSTDPAGWANIKTYIRNLRNAHGSRAQTNKLYLAGNLRSSY